MSSLSNYLRIFYVDNKMDDLNILITKAEGYAWRLRPSNSMEQRGGPRSFGFPQRNKYIDSLIME